MTERENEERALRSVALQNANSILLARRRAEDELVRTREALRQSQERLTAALAASGTGTFRWDFESSTVEWDENIGRLIGLQSAAPAPSLDTFTSAVHPDDRAEVTALFERCARDGADFDKEFRVVLPDATVHWIAVKARTLSNEAGRPLYMTGACVEITSRKAAETALRQETRILELLNETGRVLSSQLDLHGVVQAMTDAATQLSGAEFGAFFDTTSDEHGHSFQLYAMSGAPRAEFGTVGETRATAMIGATLRGEGPIRIDDVRSDPRYATLAPHFVTPEGHQPVRSCLAVAVPSRSGDVIGGLFFGHSQPGVFTDRSERLVVGVASQAGVAIDNARLFEAVRVAAEERRLLLDSERAARSAAERLSEVKDDFLATLSHELRTPLNAIIGWAQVLQRGPKDDDDYRRGLETIERNARVQTQLIEDLLDTSRITSGKLRLDVQPLHVTTCIEAAMESVEPAVQAKGIRLEAVLAPTAGPISGDPARLQQVVWNLLSNAIKFTPRNGKVQVVLERVNSHIEISVADTGIGIEADLLPHLFERFRQGDASSTRRHGGLGIGLSIVKSLVELHGGSVWAKSDGPGCGTTVTVQFPLTEVHRRAETDERRHPAGHGAAAVYVATELAGLKVLVVDDQPDARDLLKRVLEDSAAEVITAATAEEAVALLVEHRPDVLVSDIGMPVVDGFELLRRVRRLGPEHGGRTPAIALTAFARSEDRARALRAGFLVHVSKPVDPAELVATVASVAGRVDDPS